MTKQDLREYMTPQQLVAFYKWMTGQTVAHCDGRSYDHDAQTYRDDCGRHGAVYYRHDVARFLNNQPPLD
jgi:hypothetical protein